MLFRRILTDFKITKFCYLGQDVIDIMVTSSRHQTIGMQMFMRFSSLKDKVKG